MKPNRIKSKKELHQIIAKGNAKVNLVLDVRSRRPDGYHEIATVMQSLTLGDRITYVQTQDGAKIPYKEYVRLAKEAKEKES